MQGATLKRSKLSGENRIELEGAQHFQKLFPQWGLYSETIGSKPRWFIPTGNRAPEVMGRVLKELPLRERKPNRNRRKRSRSMSAVPKAPPTPTASTTIPRKAPSPEYSSWTARGYARKSMG